MRDESGSGVLIIKYEAVGTRREEVRKGRKVTSRIFVRSRTEKY
jgi:hypothetical protein